MPQLARVNIWMPGGFDTVIGSGHGSLEIQTLSGRNYYITWLGGGAFASQKQEGDRAIGFAQLLGVPSVVKLHGSDVNVIARIPGPRRQMQWLLPRVPGCDSSSLFGELSRFPDISRFLV